MPEPQPAAQAGDERPQPRFTPRPQARPPELANIERVLVVMSGKGGVGKSTVAVNLAAALKQKGMRVGIADLDITNPNAPTMTGLGDFQFEKPPFTPPETGGIPVASTAFFTPPGRALIWRGPMKQKMIVQLLTRVQWPELDLLIVDLPPGTSDEPLSVAELVPKKAGAVLVTTPQKVATEDVARSHAFADKVGMPVIGVIENMSGFTCECGAVHHLFGEGGGERLAAELDVALLGKVPVDGTLVATGDAGKPAVLADPSTPAARALLDIAQVIVDRLAPDDGTA